MLRVTSILQNPLLALYQRPARAAITCDGERRIRHGDCGFRRRFL
jgi:hypothetical protein